MTDIAALQETVEKEIRSVLMFDAAGTSLIAFVKNYRETIGRDVPFQKFGYSSLIAYLQSIKHVCQFGYQNNQPYLFCVPDEKTKHTYRMALVTKQSKPKKRGSRGRNSYSSSYSSNYSNNRSAQYSNSYSNRYRENEQKVNHEAINNVSPKKCVPDIYHNKITSVLKDVGIHGISIDLFQSLFNQHHGINLNYPFFGFTSLQTCLESVPEIVTLKKKDNDRMFCYSTPDLRQQQRQQGAIPKMSQSSVRFAPEPLPQNEARKISSSSNENESMDEYSEEEEEDMNNIIRKRMREVLQNNPNGIWSDDFLDKYEKLHGEPLDLDGIGYNNITELVDQFPNIFGITHRLKPSNKDLIYDPENPPPFLTESPTKTEDKIIPPDVIRKIQTILEANTEDLSITNFENLYKVNCGEDLPTLLHGFVSLEEFLLKLMLDIPFLMIEVRGVKFLKLKSHVKNENAVAAVARHELTPSPTRLSSGEATHLSTLNVPKDAATCSDSYRQQTIPVDLEKHFRVQVAEVLNPGNFWIQLVGLQFTEALDTLMNRLEEFYESDNSKNYEIPPFKFSLCLPCAALYEKDWHRAMITALPNESTIEIFYVDYGTKRVIPRIKAKFLKREFLELPKQAIKARLALIEPPSEMDWSLESGRKMLQLAIGKPLLCQIIDAFHPSKSLSVFLSEPRIHEPDLHINEILISEGYAKESIEEKQELLCRARDEEIRSLEEQRLYDAIGYKPYMDIPSPSPSITRSNSVVSDYPSRSCATSYIVPEVGVRYEMRNISPPVEPPYNVSPPVSGPIPPPISNLVPPPISNLVPPPSESTVKSPPGGFTKGPTYGGLNFGLIERLYRKKKLEQETSSAMSVESTQQQLIDSTSPLKSIFESSWVYDTSVFETLDSPRSVSPPVSSYQPTPPPYATCDSVAQSISNPTTSHDTNTIPTTVAYVPTVTRDSSTSPILIDGNEQMSPSNGPQQVKYVKKITFADKYHGHLINYKSKLCLTSADLSMFIYASRSINLEKQFKRMKITLETLMVDKTECLPLFMELQRERVKELPLVITLYPLESCIKALHLINFKNPKLKEELTTTINNFNPNDPYWNETDDSDEECEDLDAINEEIRELCQKREQVLSQMLNKGELDLVHYHEIYTDISEKMINRIVLRSRILGKNTTEVLRNLSMKGTSQSQRSVQAVAPLVSRVVTGNTQVQNPTAPVTVQSMPPQQSVVGPQFWMGYPGMTYNVPVVPYQMFPRVQVPFTQYTQMPYMNPNNK